MESLKPLHDRLKNLQYQAQKLIEARLALNALFVEEEIRLGRENEVLILMTVRSTVVEQLQRFRGIEASASCAHSQASAVSFMAGLAATAVVSQGNRASAIKDYLLEKATDRKEPFGLVVICIGPKGLPDDVKAMSISQSARDSNRPEPEIVNRLREDGYLLFSEDAFSLLIDRLIGDVRQGKLNLPISREKLTEIVGLNKPNSRIKIVLIE